MGTIQKVRVVDGTLHQGESLSWQVALVVMTDVDTEEELVFDFRPVLAQKTENARRELPAIRAGQAISPSEWLSELITHWE